MNGKSILILVFLSFCRESGNFHPELARAAAPVDGVLPYFQGEIMDPHWPAEEPDASTLRNIQKIDLIDDSGRTFDFKDTNGKYSIVYFFFTSCRGICPLITANVREISRRLPQQDDLLFLGITVDPTTDTPAGLAAFKREYKIEQKNWHLLTGNKGHIEELTRKQFAADILARVGKDNLMDFVHTENIFLVDRQGFLRGIYRGRGTGDLERLYPDLAMLRKSAAP
ncbi:MAG: SCO family protein [Spirochaetales bacterium]|nr:SCO family protein [Spirochaetales bacterium]